MPKQQRVKAAFEKALETLDYVITSESRGTFNGLTEVEQANREASARYAGLNEAAEGLNHDKVFLEQTGIVSTPG